MLKKIIVSACIAGIGLFVSCSDLNETSTLGGEIIKNSDPNQTDFSKNFEYFDTLSVLEQYSVAEPADTSLGDGIALVGKNNTKIVRGIFGFSHDTTIRFKNYRRTLKAATIEISANPVKRDSVTTIKLSSISVFAYHTGNITAAVNSAVARTILGKDSVDTLNKTTVSLFKDTLNKATVLSIDSTLRSYYTRDTTSREKNTLELLKLLLASDDTIFVLNNEPKLILSYDSSGTTIIDTLISRYSFNVQFDDPAVKAAFDPIPVSSVYSGRYAVFKLDLTSLWADMAKRPGFTTILSVPLVIAGQALKSSDDSTTRYFSYFISPERITDPNVLTVLIKDQGSSGSLASLQTIDTVPAERYFRPLVKDRPQTAYLYCRDAITRNTASDRSIRWSNPIITGVFTNNQ